jgi:hypothetical protein
MLMSAMLIRYWLLEQLLQGGRGEWQGRQGSSSMAHGQYKLHAQTPCSRQNMQKFKTSSKFVQLHAA